jgi:hypothetical protein
MADCLPLCEGAPRAIRGHTFRGGIMRALILAAAIAASSTAFAQQKGNPIAGFWKFDSNYTELKNGEKRNILGEKPRGYVYFSPGGRVLTVLTAQDRPRPKTEAERAAGLLSVYAVSGTYKVTGKNTYTATLEAAANENLVSTTPVNREFKIERGKLTIVTAWGPSPNIEGNPEARGVSVLSRAK